MAGLVRPRMYPIRDPKDNKQDGGIVYNPLRFPQHGGFTDAAKYPKGERAAGLMDIDPPTKIKTADVSSHKSDD